jgi:predicted RecA/RadA family phage recombinase
MGFNPKVKKYSGVVLEVNHTPNADVASGDVVVVGSLLYFSEVDIASGSLGSLAAAGAAWGGNKAAGTWTVGDRIYWDPTGNPNVGTAGSGAFTNVFAAGLKLAGFAIPSPDSAIAAATGDQFGYFIKVNGTGNDLRVISGQSTTVAASDTIVTGLNKLNGVVASLDSDPVDDPEWVTASIGDQAGTPAAGSFLLKTWKNTAGNDPTPAAATTFGKKVNWIAFGT